MPLGVSQRKAAERLYGEFRHRSLWRGRRWLRSKVRS